MSIFVDVTTDIRIAQNTQYMASGIIAQLKKNKGLWDSNYPTLIRIVRKSLEWANGSTTTTTETTDGDFSIDDFLSQDFATGIVSSSTVSEARDGVDLVANYLYALCGKYAKVAAVVSQMDCVPVWGVEFGPTFSCEGGDTPSTIIGVFSYEFNNIFN